MKPLPLAVVAAALGVAAIALAGCGGGTTPPPGNATLALGGTATDGSGFFALGGDQTLVPGAQGGFHVWLKWRIEGMAPSKVRVHRESHRVSDDTLILRADGSLDVGAPAADGWWELPAAQPSFMCPTPIGISVIDERVVFDVTVTTEDGATVAKSSAEATVHCPTDASGEFCKKICSG